MCNLICFTDTVFFPLGFEFAFPAKASITKQVISILCGESLSHCLIDCSYCVVLRILVVIASLYYNNVFFYKSDIWLMSNL